jgi:hypothetical protein
MNYCGRKPARHKTFSSTKDTKEHEEDKNTKKR